MVDGKFFFKIIFFIFVGLTEEPEEKLLPPEMFVPNQKRWLELRARNRKMCLCFCNGIQTS